MTDFGGDTVDPCGIWNCPDPDHRKINEKLNDIIAKMVEEGKIIVADPNKPPVQWKDIKGLKYYD